MFCKYCGNQVPDGSICGCPNSLRDAQAAGAYVPQQAAPQQPQYAAPQQPQYAAPQQPQYAPQPQYAAPQQPQYAPQPQYAAPQQPQYAAPQQPQYAAPQQPQYAAPQQPQYAAPQQPQYAAPQQPQYTAPQQPAGPSFGQKLGGVFKAMPNTLKGYMGNTFGACNDWMTSTVFALGGLLLHIFAWLCFAALLPNAVKSVAMEAISGLGAYASAAKEQISEMVSEMFGGIYGTGVLLGFLTYILQAGARFLIPTFGHMIRKEKVDYIHNYGVAASASLLPAAILFVAGLLSLLSFVLGMLFAVVASTLCLIVDYKLVAKQMKNTTSLVNSLILTGILTAITAIIGFIVVSIILGYFESNFGIDFSELGNELANAFT